MNRDPLRLTQQEYDLVVIGGGIFGICIAWDAALRGLSVALLERDDFGGATSAHPFKMIHGGIRYLQHGDLYRVRKSARERRFLLRAAPHLAYPLPIVVPTYSRGLERKTLLRMAFVVYDLITADRNWGISDPNRRIPGGRILSREDTLDMFPGVDRDGLTGAGVFYDGQMYNPPRLALAFLKSAVGAGATAANYMEVSGFLNQKNRVAGVEVDDRLTGERLHIRGRVVVNATGPWADQLLRDKLGIGLEPAPTFSRDTYVVVNRKLVDSHALAIQARTEDPDALISRGKRHLFVVPWRNHTLVGVWHGVHQGEPDKFSVTEAEIQEYIDEVNEACPELQLSMKDVSMWNAGLVLFGENDPEAKDLSYGKRSIIVDHNSVDALDGLITVIGIRWTTARSAAEGVVDLVYQKMGMDAPTCKTENVRAYGGDIEDFEQFTERLTRQSSADLGANVIRSLAHNYGTEATFLLREIEERPEMGERLGSSLVVRAQIVHAVRYEMAHTLRDVALRRTDLATGNYPGNEAIRQCGEVMAEELNWDGSRLQKEINELLSVHSSIGSPRQSIVV